MKTRETLIKSSNFYYVFIIIALGCATKRDVAFVDTNSREVEEALSSKREFIKKYISKKNTPNKTNKKNHIIKKEVSSSFGSESSIGNHSPIVSNKKNKSFNKSYSEVFKDYDKTSKHAWNVFNPLIKDGEKFTFKVKYFGVTAGHIQMQTLPEAVINGSSVYHFKAKMRSARYYSYFYTLDDSIDSYVSKNSFLPVKYILMQRESAQKVDDLQLFDSNELMTYHFYNRLKRGKTKEVELKKPIPQYFQDSFSALYFVRGLPLQIGDEYEFPIVTRGKIWILKINVEGTESIELEGQKVNAIRLNAVTRFPGVLEKRGDILFWYSNDKLKKLLKFEAQVKIGSVEGELVEYKSGKSPETL